MEGETRYPRWVKRILEKISVIICRGRTGEELERYEPILEQKPKLLSHGTSESKQKVFVIGFEDEKNI